MRRPLLIDCVRCAAPLPWASMGGMSEAVPPPFAEHIGTQLLLHIQNERIAA